MPLSVRAADLEVDRCPLLLVEATIAPRDGEARDEPLDVPLERAGQRLVEVVDAEDERRSGAAKPPKFDRWASPQSCVWRPVRAPVARSDAIR